MKLAKDVPTSIYHLDGINLKDYYIVNHLVYPTFHMHKEVINYYLNYFVFPYEAKQFPKKLITSAWDLCKNNRFPVTGFSGKKIYHL